MKKLMLIVVVLGILVGFGTVYAQQPPAGTGLPTTPAAPAGVTQPAPSTPAAPAGGAQVTGAQQPPATTPAAPTCTVRSVTLANGYLVQGSDAQALTVTVNCPRTAKLGNVTGMNFGSGVTVTDIVVKGNTITAKIQADSSASTGTTAFVANTDAGDLDSGNVVIRIVSQESATVLDLVNERFRRLSSADPAFRHYAQAEFQRAYGKDEGNAKFKAFVAKPNHETADAMFQQRDKGIVDTTLAGVTKVLDERGAALEARIQAEINAIGQRMDAVDGGMRETRSIVDAVRAETEDLPDIRYLTEVTARREAGRMPKKINKKLGMFGGKPNAERQEVLDIAARLRAKLEAADAARAEQANNQEEVIEK